MVAVVGRVGQVANWRIGQLARQLLYPPRYLRSDSGVNDEGRFPAEDHPVVVFGRNVGEQRVHTVGEPAWDELEANGLRLGPS